MMSRRETNMASFARMVSVFLAGLLCAPIGCASTRGTDAARSDGDHKVYSDAEVRAMTVESPFLVSGDYFRTREGAEAGTSSRAASGEKNLADAKGPLERPDADRKTPAGEEQPGPGSPAFQAARPFGGPMRTKFGLLIRAPEVSDAHQAEIIAHARACAAQIPALFLSPSELTESLTKTDCSGKKTPACYAEAISLYPGVRMLVLIESLDLPRALPGEASALVTLFDAASGIDYTLPRMRMSILTQEDLGPFFKMMIASAFASAAEKGRGMPWFCRVFSSGDGEWYVNAGALSGLKPGDRLDVVGRGKWVMAPSGLPAGWIPGPRKGTLTVKALFGEDLSVCSLVEGDRPSTEDILLKAD